MPIYYYIIIQGHLDQQRSEWLTGMTITNMDDGLAILSGPVVDQTALYGMLMKLRDLGLKLIAVQPIPSHGLTQNQ